VVGARGTLFVPASTTTRWVNALGFSRYTDAVSGERFRGDFDQRHTVNAFATYHLSDRTSARARFRTGRGG